MLSLIRKRFWRTRDATSTDCNDVRDLVIESFPRDGFVRIRNRGSAESLDIPLGGQINSGFDELHNELCRFECIKNFDRFVKKKYKKRRLIIYQGDPVHYGLIRYLVNSNTYSEYHIFCNDVDSYNILQEFVRLNDKVSIRLNEPEPNASSMFRILRNEHDEYYNCEKNNDDILVLLGGNDMIRQMYCALYWLRSCYISIPKNKFALCAMRYLFRYTLSITVEKTFNSYYILKSDNDSERYHTTEDFITLWNSIVYRIIDLLATSAKIIYNIMHVVR